MTCYPETAGNKSRMHNTAYNKEYDILNKPPVPQGKRQNLQQTGLHETKMLATGGKWAVHRIGEKEWQLFIQQRIGVQHTEKTKKTK